MQRVFTFYFFLALSHQEEQQISTQAFQMVGFIIMVASLEDILTSTSEAGTTQLTVSRLSMLPMMVTLTSFAFDDIL